VLCEKPIALNLEDADAVVNAASQAHTLLMIAQCLRFWPEYVYLKQAVDEARWGPCRSLELRRQAERPTHSQNNWLADAERSGGALMDLHIHDVDMAQYLFGRPDALTAQGTGRAEWGIDRVHALWHYRHVPCVQILGTWDLPQGCGFNMGFTAVFENAALIWDLAADRPLTLYRQDAEPEKPELPLGDTGFFGEIDYFLACIEKGKKPEVCPPEQSRDAVALALAEKESITRGQTVSID
jgi:predicted dehydrogenase